MKELVSKDYRAALVHVSHINFEIKTFFKSVVFSGLGAPLLLGVGHPLHVD